MSKEILNIFVSLIEYVCVLMVIVYIMTKTKIFQDIEALKYSPKQQGILILIFGLLSMYGNTSGVDFFGAIANTRDLGPLIAGLIGGPIAGLGAGLIGATHRYFLGGFTVIPCSVATLFAGVFTGIIHLFLRGTLIKPFWGVLSAIFFECFHMVLVILLAKPIEEAIALVYEISLPMIIGNAVGMGLFLFIIANYRKEQAIKNEKEKIENDLKVAHEIQTNMLPSIFPPFPDKVEFDIFASMDPAKEVGGDFYDFFMLGEDKLCMIIGDVSGKGIPAVLFMVIVKTLIKTEGLRNIEPGDILNRVNQILIPDNKSCMFATVYCAILNIKNGEFNYSNAGHNPPLIYRKSKGAFEYMSVDHGFVLGVMDVFNYKTCHCAIEPGDFILLYTDGVTEAMNSKQELYSEKRLLNYMNSLSNLEVEPVIKSVRFELKWYIKDEPQSDDITMLAFKYKSM
ncbi:MAG: SpoIIE family protein phosphatase [bacterium]|nr:SpoIIE family protein phosphatase [bacterium]